MRPKSLATTTVGVVLAILTIACAGLPTIDEPTPQPSTTVPVSSGATASPRPSQSGTSLEGRFTYSTMDDYVDEVLNLITPWLTETWPQMPQPRAVYVPHGVVGPEDCLDANGDLSYYSSESYEYCGAERKIYVGQDTLWEFYTEAGDAGPAVGLAHEFGHHVQQWVGIPAPQTTQAAIKYENQADCVAGGWVRYTDQKGWLEYPDDIEDINALLPLIGAAEGPDRDHGTASERASAFQVGFGSGVAACTSFFPGYPLTPSG